MSVSFESGMPAGGVRTCPKRCASRGFGRPRGLAAFVLAAIAALTFAACLALAPQPALAKSYSMPQVEISAEVQKDGTLSVQEKRVFDFDGSFTCVWWTFEGFPQGSEFQVEGVSMARESAGLAGAGTLELEPVPFQTQWRDSGGPGRACYSVDAARDSVYVFFDADDEVLDVWVEYSISNAVQVYGDVAELYWQYVGSQWAEPSDDVVCRLRLPRPEGEPIVSGENVRVWAHGPLDGSVTVDEYGMVRCQVPQVPSGEFAEVRTTFPVEWLSGVDPAAVHDYDGLPGILEEEQKWADQANAHRAAAMGLLAVCVIVAIALIVWALVMFLRHGKEYKASFHEEYWRDVPDPKAQPPEIGRLWRWEKESPDDFTAEIMQLAHKGAILMEKGSYPDERGRLVEDYCMVKVPEVADAVNAGSDPVGRAVLDMLFDKFPAGDSAATESSQQHVWFGTINKYGKKHPEEFSSAMSLFQATLSRKVDNLDYFEAKGSMLKMAMATIAMFAAIGSVVLGFWIENFVPAVAGVVAGIVLFAISRFMSRMTRHGAEVRAKAEALKRWLTDFSALDERPPTDVKVWGEFMVYAYEFGIAEQVMKELRLKVPELFVEEAADSVYVPWWFWYSPHYMHGAGVPLANALSNTVANTVSTVNAALSSSSSGSGMGGGFSMGGGGGFGGGGGGAR